MEADLSGGMQLAIGAFVITNIGAIVTVASMGAKIIYNYAVLVTTVKALHERQDRLEKMLNTSDKE